jgi:hypothetical protein
VVFENPLKKIISRIIDCFFCYDTQFFLVTINFRDTIFTKKPHSTLTNTVASSNKPKPTTVPSLKKPNKAKIEQKAEKKDTEIEIIETAKVELFEQQKTSFPFDPELLGNLDFKKDRKLSKEELIKYVPEKNNSINVDSKSLKQENKNQSKSEKKLTTVPKINLPTTTSSATIIATSSTTAPIPIPTEINQDKAKSEKNSISTLVDSISSEKKQTKVKQENKIEAQKKDNSVEIESLAKNNDSNDKKLFYDDQPVLWKDLSPKFKQNMPKMKLNGITFFEKEKDRYVIINMYKYQLDDVIKNGPTIDEIRKDSIIMFYKDKQFILPLGL